MRRLIFHILAIIFLCNTPVLAANNYYVGFSQFELTSIETGQTFPVAISYPSVTASTPVSFGPFEMELSMEGTIAKGNFPLAIISHGSGGSHLSYRSIAFALVKQGFIVAMPLHPKNNYQDNSAAGTTENWRNRPKHIKSVIDAVLANNKLSSSINTEKIAVIGHSAGGYTALAVAGAMASTAQIVNLCKKTPQINRRFCALKNGTQSTIAKITNPRDTRVKALVLLAPVGILFDTKNAFSQINIPVLLFSAEKDAQLIEPYHSDIIVNHITPKMLTYQQVNNAGHYSFITPFPRVLQNQLGLVAKDPEGFDRVEFHKILSQKIVNYLVEIL